MQSIGRWAASGVLVLSIAWFVNSRGVFAGPLVSKIPAPDSPSGEEQLRLLHPDGASRMSCVEIVHTADRMRQPADPGDVGKLLGQNAAWVERCLVTFGRRIRKSAAVNLDAKEDVEEVWEGSSEADETGREETGDAEKPRRAEETPRPTRRPRENLDPWQR